MKRFGGDRVRGLMEWAGMDEDTPIENRLVNRSIESAQVKVEGYNFDIRKHLVEYDDVINQQREIIYGERHKILSGADLKANILSMVTDEIGRIVDGNIGAERNDETVSDMLAEVSTIFPLPPEQDVNTFVEMRPAQVEERLVELAESVYDQKEQELGTDNMRMLERLLMLRIIDSLWVEHLTEMDHMRHGIGLQAAAQRDPLVAYKREGAVQFDALMDTIYHDVVHSVFHVNLTKQPTRKRVPAAKMVASRGDDAPKQVQPAQPVKVAGKKVGRNDPCPCGSGKKYKYCCGR
jgi:preprotein translocase subunit SecA